MTGTSRSLERGLRILSMFSPRKREWTVAELGKALEIPPASAYRVVQSLARAAFLERSNGAGAYKLGISALRLASVVLDGLNVREVARPVMQRLAGEIGETIVLLVPGADCAICIETVEGLSPIRPQALRVGEHVAYNGGSAPLAIFAFLPVAEQERIVEAGLPRLTERTIVDPADLGARCQEIRSTGISYSLGEMIPRTLAVAAPIFSSDGSPVAGAIGLTGIDDLQARLPELREAVARAANEISQRLGALSVN